ncbi:Fe-S cluster assembly protein HesB [Chloroflexus islandicus]|uniref:Fe-S cluster assembly protein HesB n=1 Tax=Chloroflexus islandicus TaxID=1707952 RepID=A0A178MDG2_9CHLR|nr:Fe-S cluster assembly protein HesB [Chloroflexus islandicus]OAN46556.1 Fe-S cluster assembly protein HesB [Chloroflexus islandicus]
MMSQTNSDSLHIIDIYHRLVAHFGPLHGPQATSPWWPIVSDNPQLEMVIGAVLVQQTRWETVEAAVMRMHAAGLLDLAALAEAEAGQLAALIYPCAFYRQKASGLIALARAIQERYGDLATMLSRPTVTLRAELLQLPRIGPETADVILLYAGQHPLFVVDAYTRRIFARVAPERLAWERVSYAQVQQAIAGELPADPVLLADFHAQLNELAVRYCLVRPRCDGPPARRVYSRQPGRNSFLDRHDGCPLRAVCKWYRDRDGI